MPFRLADQIDWRIRAGPVRFSTKPELFSIIVEQVLDSRHAGISWPDLDLLGDAEFQHRFRAFARSMPDMWPRSRRSGLRRLAIWKGEVTKDVGLSQAESLPDSLPERAKPSRGEVVRSCFHSSSTSGITRKMDFLHLKKLSAFQTKPISSWRTCTSGASDQVMASANEVKRKQEAKQAAMLRGITLHDLAEDVAGRVHRDPVPVIVASRDICSAAWLPGLRC